MRKVIVTSFDQNYIDYSRVMLYTLSINYHDETPLDVVCLVPANILHMQDYYIKSLGLENLNISFVTSDKYLSMVEDGIDTSHKDAASNCNHRMFIGSACADYDVAIYIDPDTIIMREVSPLLTYPLRNDFMAMVEMTDANVVSFNDPDRPYFSNGIFIADLNFWREEGIEEKLINLIKNGGPLFLAEQDAMNSILIDYWSPLPMSFNMFDWMVYANPHIAEANSNPLIVHFVGVEKPWKSRTITPYSNYWRKVYSDLSSWDSQISNMNSAQ